MYTFILDFSHQCFKVVHNKNPFPLVPSYENFEKDCPPVGNFTRNIKVSSIFSWTSILVGSSLKQIHFTSSGNYIKIKVVIQKIPFCRN